MARLIWDGERIKQMVRTASRDSIQNTLEEAVKGARRKHPGWRSRSGRLEASIQVFDVREVSDGVVGRWGAGAFYARFLEKGTSKMRPKQFLKPAARTPYRRLRFRVRNRFRQMLTGVRNDR